VKYYLTAFYREPARIRLFYIILKILIIFIISKCQQKKQRLFISHYLYQDVLDNSYTRLISAHPEIPIS
jgi:hypothetical protein